MIPDAEFDDQPVRLLRRIGKGKLLASMQALFERDGPARMAAIRAALAIGDAAGAARPAHSLKSSAGQLGAVGLQRACDEIEKAAENGDMVALEQRSARAEQLMHRALERNRSIVENEEMP